MDHEKDMVVGRNAVLELIKSQSPISRILVSNKGKEGSIISILALAKKRGILIKEVSPDKLNGLFSGGNHQGVIAFISPIEYIEPETILENAKEKNQDPLIVILDGIMDVHNLGAIARTCEACGAHGLIMGKHRAAPVTPTAVKASAGALFHLPVARVTNIANTIDFLKEQGVWVAGTHQEGETSYYDANLTGPLAIVIGSEDKGMSALVHKKCDFHLHIPMKGKMSSLNASNAAAIVLFEALKQREK